MSFVYILKKLREQRLEKEESENKLKLLVEINDWYEENGFNANLTTLENKLNLIENVSMENILNLYSNYLDMPENIDIDYQMNLVMKVNKFMSANLSLQAIYDDNANPIKSEIQIREVFGLGVNYNF